MRVFCTLHKMHIWVTLTILSKCRFLLSSKRSRSRIWPCILNPSPVPKWYFKSGLSGSQNALHCVWKVDYPCLYWSKLFIHLNFIHLNTMLSSKVATASAICNQLSGSICFSLKGKSKEISYRLKTPDITILAKLGVKQDKVARGGILFISANSSSRSSRRPTSRGTWATSTPGSRSSTHSFLFRLRAISWWVTGGFFDVFE